MLGFAGLMRTFPLNEAILAIVTALRALGSCACAGVGVTRRAKSFLSFRPLLV